MPFLALAQPIKIGNSCKIYTSVGKFTLLSVSSQLYQFLSVNYSFTPPRQSGHATLLAIPAG